MELDFLRVEKEYKENIMSQKYLQRMTAARVIRKKIIKSVFGVSIRYENLTSKYLKDFIFTSFETYIAF